MIKRLTTVCALAALLACSPQAQGPADEKAAPEAAAPAAPVTVDAPSGAYTLDKAHASLVFRVSHLGFSHYTAKFATFDAQLQLDKDNPTNSRVNVTIDPRSLTLDNPPPGFKNELLGAQWLNAAQFPQMTFTTTNVETTSPTTARVTGDFTMHGVTKPVTLDVTYNGSWAGNTFDPHGRIGFSARGVLKRSDFGISQGLPPPGTQMGVSDDVEIAVEAELTGPAWTPPANPPAPAQ